MYDWVGDIIGAMGNAIGEVFETLGTQISNSFWDATLQWFYEIIYGAISDFFENMGNMGAEIFDLDWVKATISLIGVVLVELYKFCISLQNTFFHDLVSDRVAFCAALRRKSTKPSMMADKSKFGQVWERVCGSQMWLLFLLSRSIIKDSYERREVSRNGLSITFTTKRNSGSKTSRASGRGTGWF